MASGLSFQVRHSGIWQLSSIVLASAGQVLVVDPGYFPRELAELASLAAAAGQVTAVVFTHGHWDHVMGWRQFPGAAVLASRSLRQAVLAGDSAAEKDLREAAEFDRRWYIDRGEPPAWPPGERLRALDEGQLVTVGDAQLSALHLPGHSPDGLGLWAVESGLLVVGDYLSPCEIPFVADLSAYRQTLRRLLHFLPDARCVLPGHGPVLTAQQARAIAEADLSYMDALAECAARPSEAATVAQALAIALPRAAEVAEMHAHHRDNCRAAGLPVPLAASSTSP